MPLRPSSTEPANMYHDESDVSEGKPGVKLVSMNKAIVEVTTFRKLDILNVIHTSHHPSDNQGVCTEVIHVGLKQRLKS